MKRKTMIKVVGWVALFGLMAALVLGGCGGAAPAPTTEKTASGEPIGNIFIAIVTDLTGPTSADCVPNILAHVAPFEIANKKGGLVYMDPKTGKQERVTFTWEMADNQAQVGPCPAIYKRLMTKNPLFWISGSSASTIALANQFEQDKVTCVSHPTNLDVYYPFKRYIFGMMPSYPEAGAAAIKWAAEDWKSKGKSGNPKLAWFAMNVPFGKAQKTVEVEAYAKSMGVDIAGEWWYPPMPVDLTAEFKAMEAAGVNYTTGNETPYQAAAVAKEITRLGLKDKIKVIHSYNSMNEPTIELAGDALEGMVGMGCCPPRDDANNPVMVTYQKIAKEHNLVWGWSTAICLAAGGPEGIEIVKAALEKRGWPLTTDNMADAWEQMATYSYGPAPFGVLRSYSSTDHRSQHHMVVQKFVGRRVVNAGEWFKLPDMTPK